MSKQDRQAVRTPAQLEQKYNFGQVFNKTDESTNKLAGQVSRLTQSLSSYSAITNGKIANLEEKDKNLENYINGIILELAEGIEIEGESGEV